MIVLLILLFTAVIAFGLYLILTSVFKLPIRAKKRTKIEFKKRLNIFIDKIASKYVEPHIKLNVQKASRLTRALENTNNKTTATLFEATALVKAAVVLLIGILGMVINLFIGLLSFLLAILVYYYDFQSLYRLSNRYKQQIDDEAPAFASYIKEKLSSERNVINLLEEYTLTDNESFARELEITVASMRTSSPENGLLQLNKRISSDKFNMIIQGLLAVVRGEDQQFYFQMISYDFDVIDRNNLRKRVQKIPQKLNVYMFLLFSAVLVEFLTPVLIDISIYFKEFFN